MKEDLRPRTTCFIQYARSYVCDLVCTLYMHEHVEKSHACIEEHDLSGREEKDYSKWAEGRFKELVPAITTASGAVSLTEVMIYAHRNIPSTRSWIEYFQW